VLLNAGARFVELTAAEGTQIFLSVQAIIAVRDSDAHSDPPGAHAVVNVAGHRQAVRRRDNRCNKLSRRSPRSKLELADMENHSAVAPTRRFTDAQYNLVSWALNSFGVPLDDFLPKGGP
jgi:hypothetical protein